jgi:uncharacterized protein YjbI with pentapeptide repeats
MVRDARPMGFPLKRNWGHAYLAVTSIAIAAVGILILVLGPIARWATPAKGLSGKEAVEAQNSTRQILLTAVGGLALLGGLGFTARTYHLTRRGQFTDRYMKAIPQLASENTTERLGAIYALEHIMRESEADHSTIVEILATFIRENACATPPVDPEPEPEPAGLERKPRLRVDIQAALTVLARRPSRREFGQLDLSGTDLRGADLRWARFDVVNLGGAWLDHANLSSAKLRHAFLRNARMDRAWLVHTNLAHADLIEASLDGTNLGGANLSDCDLSLAVLNKAHLREADMRKASLVEARLTGAYMVDANLRGAILKGANLTTADLRNADLRQANLLDSKRGVKTQLTVAQISQAWTNRSTQVSESLKDYRSN